MGRDEAHVRAHAQSRIDSAVCVGSLSGNGKTARGQGEPKTGAGGLVIVGDDELEGTIRHPVP